MIQPGSRLIIENDWEVVEERFRGYNGYRTDVRIHALKGGFEGEAVAAAETGFRGVGCHPSCDRHRAVNRRVDNRPGHSIAAHIGRDEGDIHRRLPWCSHGLVIDGWGHEPGAG